MSARPLTRRRVLDDAGLEPLSSSELAVALCVSDMPDRCRGDVPLGQIAVWARQGVDRLGVARIKQIDVRARRLVLSGLGDDGLFAPGVAAQLREIWGSQRRQQASTNRAHELRFTTAWVAVGGGRR
jgi:hypothetical protein